ncbi:MAG: Uma2 family endonuclease [Thermodesulfobacteriota bacterium]
MALPLRKHEGFTYRDYRTWSEDERWELIAGVPFCMTPAPSTRHQRLAGEMYKQIAMFLTGRDCEVFFAPFDVRLAQPDADDDETDTVVQPDIVVVCDPARIDEHGCKGAPDFVIEILSPATAVRDCITKLALYQEHGVREYWIVSPDEKAVTVHLLREDGRYEARTYRAWAEPIPVTILPGLDIDLGPAFGATAGPPEQRSKKG